MICICGDDERDHLARGDARGACAVPLCGCARFRSREELEQLRSRELDELRYLSGLARPLRSSAVNRRPTISAGADLLALALAELHLEHRAELRGWRGLRRRILDAWQNAERLEESRRRP